MSRALYFILLVFIILGLTSCYTSQVYSDYNRSVDFKQYKSFAWLPHLDTTGNNFLDNQLVEKNVNHFSNAEMLNRGYKIDTLEPDLLLEYRLTSERKTYTINNQGYMPNYGYNMSPYNNPYGYNNPYNRGYNQQQVEYLEGTLLIDIIDRKTNQLIWRGWSIGSINNEAQLESELPADIHRIFNKYPIYSSQKSGPASWPQHGQSSWPQHQQRQQTTRPVPQTQSRQQQPKPTTTPSTTNDSPPAKKNKKAKKTTTDSSDEI